MNEIPLSNGMIATVSPEDFTHLSQYRWHASPSKQRWQRAPNWYAYRFIEMPRGPCGTRRRRKVYMHREVLERMGHDLAERVGDHMPDGRGTLDNRRENLRPATHKQNFAYSTGTESADW